MLGLKILVLLFLLQSFLSKSSEFICGGEEESEHKIQEIHYDSHPLLQNAKKTLIIKRSTQSTYNNIRIKFDYSHISQYLSATEINNGLKRVLEIGREKVEELLKVIPIQEPLKPTVDTCGEATIPDNYKTSGSSDTDLLIFIYGVVCSDSASATSCEFNQFSRPIVGGIKICVDYGRDLSTRYDGSDSDFMNLYYDSHVMIHEMMHILGVSKYRYPNFINRNTGQKYEDGEVLKTFTERGHEISKIVTPTALNEARKLYGCPTLNGVEMGTKTADLDSSHTSYRTMFGDIMNSGRYWWRPKISNITLAILYDSGWYEINWEKNENVFVFGYKGGCGFAMNKCLTPGVLPTVNPDAPKNHYCSGEQVKKEENEEGKHWYCSHDRLERVKCGKYVETGISDIPDYFQYWTNDPTKGGKYQAGYCPFFHRTSKNYKEGFCQRENQLFRESNYWGEITGPFSFCMDSNLMLEGKDYDGYGYDMSIRKGLCYNITFIDEENGDVSIDIGIKGSESSYHHIICKKEDEGQLKTVEGFTGALMCPDIDVLSYQKRNAYVDISGKLRISFGKICLLVIAFLFYF